MTELYAESGHWVWDRDIDYNEYIQAHAGYLASGVAGMLDMVGRVPEHWFKKQEDGQIWVKVVNKFTGEAGNIDTLDPSGTPKEGEMEVPVAGKLTGSGKTIFEQDGTALNTYLEAASQDGEKFTLSIKREIKDGEYWLTLENQQKDIRCSRIFKRFPYYKVVNETGQTVSLTTYNAGDMVCFVSAMKVDIASGTHFIDASGPAAEEEQAVFALPDGRRYTNINIKAFETVTLTDSLFE